MLLLKHTFKTLGTIILFAAWFMGGWPPIWQNPRIPPKIPVALAAAAFVQSASCNLHNSASCTATLGSGATANNLLVAFCGSKNSVTLTDVFGYTLVQSNESVTSSLESWYKVANGGETSITCTVSSGSYVSGMILEYSGIDTATPLDASLTDTGLGVTTANCPSVTPSSGNHVYVSGLIFNANSNISNWSNSFTERLDQTTGGGSPTDRFIAAAADKVSTGAQSTVASSGSLGNWRCHTIAFNEAAAAVVSVNITTDATISYGILSSGESKNTIDLADTQTAQNDGNVAEDLNIKTSVPAGWSLGATAGSDTFVHEFSINGGGNWTKFAIGDTYQSLVSNILVSGTQIFDLRFTAPDPSTSVTEKTITITIQAVEH